MASNATKKARTMIAPTSQVPAIPYPHIGFGFASEILAEPERVVDRCVNVAAGDRIAEAIEGVPLPFRRRLRTACHESGKVDLALVHGTYLEVAIETVYRLGSVLD